MDRACGAERRINRELKTVQLMIELFCRNRHGGSSAPCDSCRALFDYARQRVDRCRFRTDKPTCANCAVHCFKPSMREQVRAVMRYSGPRMLWRHPILTLLHLIDGRRKPPPCPSRL